MKPNITLAEMPRQRHLLFGHEGGGKTSALLSIAAWFQGQGTKHTDYLISPQGGEDNLMRQWPGLDIVRLPVETWVDFRQWLRGHSALSPYDLKYLSPHLADTTWPGLASLLGPGDRLYIDMAADIEKLLRDYYCVKQFKRTYADVVALHQNKDRGDKLLGMPSGFDEIDPGAYPKMNVLSEEALGWVTARSGVNLFITTAAQDIQYKGDGTTPRFPTDRAFLPIGATPQVNKYLKYDVDTIAYMVVDGGRYYLQTVKKARGVVGSDKPSKRIEIKLDAGGYWFAYCDFAGLDPYREPGV